jgi:hypothetical protein
MRFALQDILAFIRCMNSRQNLDQGALAAAVFSRQAVMTAKTSRPPVDATKAGY